MFVTWKRFNQLDKQVDAIAERLNIQVEESFHKRKRRAFWDVFGLGGEWVDYHELTLKGKVDLILDHLGLDLKVNEPDGVPSVKVTKKKAGKK